MLRVPAALEKAGLQAKMILQVHDELVVECPTDLVKQVAAVVQQAMETAFTLDVPLLTEAKHGINWGQMSVLPR
jgi:DNA polymerase-1